MKSIVIFTTVLIIFSCIHGAMSGRNKTKIISDDLCDGENAGNILCGIARAEGEHASKESNAEDEHAIDQDDESNAEVEIEGEENLSDVEDKETNPIEKIHPRPRASASRSRSGTYPRRRRKLQKLHAKSHLPQEPRLLKEYTPRKSYKVDNNKTGEDNTNKYGKRHKDNVSNKKNEYGEHQGEEKDAFDSLRQRRENDEHGQDTNGKDSYGLGKYFVYVNCNSCKVSSRLVVGGKGENNTSGDNATIFRRSLDDRQDGEDYLYQGNAFNSDYEQRIKKHQNYTVLN